MLNTIALLVAVSPCFVIIAALLPGRWLERISAPRWRSFCAHFLFLACGFLALAFWFFVLDAPWQFTACAVAFAALSAVCCLLSAAALAVRQLFRRNPPKSTLGRVDAEATAAGTTFNR